MKRTIISFVCAAALILAACTQTTQSMFGDDRSQLMLISADTLNAQAEQSYARVLAEARQNRALNTNKALTKRVNRISKQLIAVAPQLRADCENWNWQVNTITSNTINAWCMPGGKIVVYTGLNDALKLNDDELAFILAHEVSHALKEHSRESASKQAVQSGLTTLANLFGVSKNVTDLANGAYNLGIGMAFSRDQESEADKYGLELVYRAGFDVQGSVTGMQKMARLEAQEGGSSQGLNGFLTSITSSHPTSEKRFSDLKALIAQYDLNNENSDKVSIKRLD